MSETPAASVIGSTPEFPFEWEQPGDEQLDWEWDDMHMPFSLTRLAEDYVRLIAHGLNAPYELYDHPARVRLCVWNGYAYFAGIPNAAGDERVANRERFVDRCRERAEVTAAYWATEAMPELAEIYGRLDGIDVDALTGEALAAAWSDAWSTLRRAWEIHFNAILGPYQVTEDLSDLYEKAVPDASPGEALRLIQGLNEDLYSVALDLDGISDAVATSPAIVARLASTPAPTVDELGALHDGAEVARRINAFLERHGHLGQAFDDLEQPSYAEEPALLMAEIAKRAERQVERAPARRQRLRAEAQRYADRARTALAEQPEELARFEHLLALAEAIGPLTEGHNYWIDRKAQAKLRRLALRVGQRLVREGTLAAAADVLLFDQHETAEAIRRPGDRRALAAARRGDLEHWRSVRPPAKLGTPDAERRPVDRFDAAPVTSTEANVLKGTGASSGVVRGPARVALGNVDFPRIQPGDIIVCPSSNPSWVPVFTIAGGLVTNTGGVLSHAAVVAREFALPAVVGVKDATTTIVDGQTVEIDGTEGTVRLL